MADRLYIVTEPNHAPRLIEAANPAQAIRHCAKKFAVRVAKASDVALLMSEGAKVEKTGEEA